MPRPSVRERFNTKWEADPVTGCWVWTASIHGKGYGSFSSKLTTGLQAHRHGWVLYRGKLPSDMHLDHICRNRLCVNPDHLRLVTPAQNAIENSLGPSALNKRKTHCVRGHPLSGANLSPARSQRRCRACERLRQLGRTAQVQRQRRVLEAVRAQQQGGT